MVDIHCHILPALDDGAVEESVARVMAARIRSAVNAMSSQTAKFSPERFLAAFQLPPLLSADSFSILRG